MTDIQANLGAQRLEGEQARHRHRYDRPPTQAAIEAGDVEYACRCGKRKDPAATRKGRSSTRLGKDQERRIERVYGPTKVGEYGDAIDLLGRDFKWQAKSTRVAIPPKYDHDGIRAYTPTRSDLTALYAMDGLHDELVPLLIRSFVRNGTPTRDVIITPTEYWADMHGGSGRDFDDYWLAMTGEHFLDVHGRDER